MRYGEMIRPREVGGSGGGDIGHDAVVRAAYVIKLSLYGRVVRAAAGLEYASRVNTRLWRVLSAKIPVFGTT